MVSVILTSVPLTESTLTELSPRLATSAILPSGLKFSPDGCLPPVMVAASFGGSAFMSMTKILLSGTCLSALPSLTTSTESATSATAPVGSMSTLTGGPTTEFSSGSEATILGVSGLARSTIRTESLPGAASTVLPSSSQVTFSSMPTIMNGLAQAWLTPAPHSIVVASANPSFRKTVIFAFSLKPASHGRVGGRDITRRASSLLVPDFRPWYGVVWHATEQLTGGAAPANAPGKAEMHFGTSARQDSNRGWRRFDWAGLGQWQGDRRDLCA